MTPVSRSHITVGVIGCGDRPSRWQEQCIKGLLESDRITVYAMVSRSSDRRDAPTDSFLFRLYQRFASPPDAWRGADWPADVRSDSPSVVDVIVSLAAPVSPQQLKATRVGALWFDGLLEQDRCQASFSRIAVSEPVNDVQLVVATHDDPEPRVLQSGTVRAFPYSLTKTVDNLLFEVSSWLLPAVCRMVDSRPPITRRISATETTVTSIRTLSLLWFVCLRFFRHLFNVLFVDEYWQVGVVAAPIQRVCRGDEPLPVEWIPNPGKGRFLADPFGVKKDGKLHVLCEDYDFDGRGTIAALTMDEADMTPKPTTMSFRTHASYPFLFSRGQDVFCVPATAGEREVAMYRSVELPDKWIKEAVLLRDVQAVDTTLFDYDGRQWLSCTMKDSPDLKLYLYYFNEETQTWDAHLENPVKIDIRSARPAGSPFIVDGTLYRPAQDSSLGYGSRITINRVTKITPAEFSEESVAFVESGLFGPGMTGLHTVSAAEDWTLIDVKRGVVTGRKIKRLLRKLI